MKINVIQMKDTNEVKLTITENNVKKDYIVGGHDVTQAKMKEVFENFLKASQSNDSAQIAKTIKAIRNTAEPQKNYSTYKCFITSDGKVEFHRVIDRAKADAAGMQKKVDKLVLTIDNQRGVTIPSQANNTPPQANNTPPQANDTPAQANSGLEFKEILGEIQKQYPNSKGSAEFEKMITKINSLFILEYRLVDRDKWNDHNSIEKLLEEIDGNKINISVAKNCLANMDLKYRKLNLDEFDKYISDTYSEMKKRLTVNWLKEMDGSLYLAETIIRGIEQQNQDHMLVNKTVLGEKIEKIENKLKEYEEKSKIIVKISTEQLPEDFTKRLDTLNQSKAALLERFEKLK